MQQTSQALPRLAEKLTEEALFVGVNIVIAQTKWHPENADAVVPATGQDELLRVEKACELYNQGHAKCMLVGRADHDEVDFHKLDLPGLQKHCGLIRTNNVYIQAGLTDTADHMRWVMRQVDKLDLRSIVLITASYHSNRTLGTAIQAMNDVLGKNIAIVPASVGHLFDPVPEQVRKTGLPVDGFQMLTNEIARYRNYCQKGDVASLTEVKEYLEWMITEHPELCSK